MSAPTLLEPVETLAPRKLEEDEEEAAELDESGRFSRYSPEVGTGRFKHVYKGFDEKQGIDIAWSRILQDANELTDEQMEAIVADLAKGLQLDHPNIIRCYKAWQDRERRCINFITEFFTSGNLRDFRQRHQHLELKAVKKWGKQILTGLAHLHNRGIVHGDLRCDKIYINGHSGEIKIGDLGLATLQERRFAPELSTIKILDRANQQNWPEIVELVTDAETKDFILRCVAPLNDRPQAKELLDHPFLAIKKDAPKRELIRPLRPPQKDTSQDRSVTQLPGGAALVLHSPTYPSSLSSDDAADGSAAVKAGIVRGEDYQFHFTGKLLDGKLSFRLKMRPLEEVGENGLALVSDLPAQTIDFVYDPEEDTPEVIATEIGGEFDLSRVDRDICAAALREWLALGVDDREDGSQDVGEHASSDNTVELYISS